MSAAEAPAIELRTHASIRDLGAEQWQRLTGPETPPFLAYAWLEALESSGCATPERGWLPLFISLWSGGVLLGAAPAYVKGHSMGEFVFDHAWARFAEENLGIEYYPKLVVAVPFTPATGPRLLVDHESVRARGLDGPTLRRAFSTGLRQLIEGSELSSGHVLFLPGDDAEAMAHEGFCLRHGVQFHWRNAGYACFEDFVERFPSKKRNQLRRERKELGKQGLGIEILTGSDIDSELIDHMYVFYKNTVDRFFWGRRYLNRAFFEEIAQRMPEQLHIVVARESSSRRPVAGAFNLLGKNALYGRYWGATEEYRFLHFNVCFYEGINDCIRRGLELFEPGAGGEHKLARGFEPTLTHSVHHLKHPVLARAVTQHLVEERQAIRAEVARAELESVLRPVARD